MGTLTFALPACTVLEERFLDLHPPESAIRHSAYTQSSANAVVPRTTKAAPSPSGVMLAQALVTPQPTLTDAPVNGVMPISLAVALSLTQANPLDIQIAEERLRAANAEFDQARLQWLPNLNIGVDYFRHDGQIQDIVGTVFTTSRSSLMLGYGPQAVVSVSDAIFAPLAAKQVARAAANNEQTTRNDTALSVAIAYFDVQQARGEVAAGADTLKRAEDLVQRTEKLAPELAPDLEINRAKTELARRRQSVESAYERWQIASAELSRLLRLEAGTIVEPTEEPALVVPLIDQSLPLPEMMALALTYRPELASHQAVVQAALARVQQEKRRPFLPRLSLRGVGSNTPGLAGGYFGGGINDDIANFGSRFSVDLQAVWEFQNLGLGNQAMVKQRQAQSRQAFLELQRMQEIITAEVMQAHTQVTRSSNRLASAAEGVKNALVTAEKNLLGLGQTKRSGEQLVLVFRPIEAVAAIAALDQAYRDYYQAVGDQNRSQFRLYRALGHPAQALLQLATPANPLVVPPILVTPPLADQPVPQE